MTITVLRGLLFHAAAVALAGVILSRALPWANGARYRGWRRRARRVIAPTFISHN